MESIHKSVLLDESIKGLDLREDKPALVVDGTFGGGGHSLEILKRYPKTKIIAIDQDLGAWERSKHKFVGFEENIKFVNANFRQMDQFTEEKVDAVLLDLGMSSDQFEVGRGFSFKRDEPLLMTMKKDIGPQDTTAKQIVNEWSEQSLEDIFLGYGEERFAKRIAKAIALAREEKKIETTFELVQVIESSVPSFYKKRKIHFATKVFQALRIATNDELRALQEGLEKGFEILKSGGRFSVIAFHSLEDRAVKNFFREKFRDKKAVLINKKPLVPTEEELAENKRSRSAKLRILEKTID